MAQRGPMRAPKQRSKKLRHAKQILGLNRKSVAHTSPHTVRASLFFHESRLGYLVRSTRMARRARDALHTVRFRTVPQRPVVDRAHLCGNAAPRIAFGDELPAAFPHGLAF